MMAGESFTRRKLPHWYVPGAAHFVTYRLAGTIPHAIVQQWREQRSREIAAVNRNTGDSNERIERAQELFFAKYDEYLDSHHGAAHLANEAVALLVQENLRHHDGEKYHLLAYCVMPNHVHVLL